MSPWLVLPILALLSWLGTIAYRRAWTRAKGGEITPKGYGALLPFFITAYAFITGASAEAQLDCAIISVLTAIYWIDDISDLKVALRFSLQFGTGALLAWLILRGGTGHLPLPLPMPLACVIAGAANVGLTNMINFYDGADLHIATLLMLLAAVPLILPPANPDLAVIALAMLAFVLPFAVVNRTPRSLYYGDAGSFAMACLITLVTIVSARDGDHRAAFFATPLILPAMDVAYVFALRLRLKEDLLSRNYHHLYQQLQIRYRGFWYLLPQPVFAAVLLAAAFALMGAGLGTLLSVIAASLVLTPLLYFGARAMFIK